MKQIIIKSALMRIVAVLLLTFGTISASAQYYMNVVQKDGSKVQYLVSNIDSVYFSATNFEYVDLGLSVKWATFNVGATKPEEYGDYYAWGETETKSLYDYTTYKWCKGSNTTLTKYCNDRNYGYEGFTDTLTILAPEDDVAHVKWGGSWRIPTKAEQNELYHNCTWTWTTLNGVNGYLVTSKKTGYTEFSIFLPACGYLGGGGNGVGYEGYYMSSSLYADMPYWACNFHILMDNMYWTDALPRANGLCVRPVCP